MATQAAPPLDMEGMYIPAKRIMIGSVFPKAVITKIARRAPISEFKIPAATKDKDGRVIPAYLPVEDTWESKATSGGGLIRILAQHTAQHIVGDQTIHLFRCNASERAYPGIFVCAGDVATPEEIEDAIGCQNRYYEYLVNAARELARQERVGEVQEDMRMAGSELGIVGEAWQKEISRDQQKKCVWCSEFIDKSARRCGKCSGFQSEEDAKAFAAMNSPAPPVRQALPNPQPQK